MFNLNQASLIGIDGGGTRCRIALLLQGQRFEAQAGPANAFTDIDGAAAAVHAGLEKVAKAAGRDLGALCDIPAYLGLAGVIAPSIAEAIAVRLPLRNAKVADDRSSALVGALGDADGAVVSIGTGSFLGRQDRGSVRLIGGYGLTLGDEASGAWLGRALLSRLLHVVDGLHRPSDLTKTTFDHFGRDIAEVVRFAATAKPTDFGRFAPEIATAAAAGDEAGVALMQAGASYVTRGLSALGWKMGERLVLLGGVADSYGPFLDAECTAPEGSALDGALVLAARLAGCAP